MNKDGYVLLPIDEKVKQFLADNLNHVEDNRKSCFVIMPFNQEKPQKIYERYVKSFIEKELKFDCIRIDEYNSSVCSITDNIKNNIRRCSFAIADITSNPIENIITRIYKEYKEKYTLFDNINDSDNVQNVINDIKDITEIYFKKKGVVDIEEKAVTINMIKKEGGSYNANVFYEIGFAHAIGKPLILIKDKQLGELPFDIQGYNVIVYDSDQIINKSNDKIHNEFFHALSSKISKILNNDNIIPNNKNCSIIVNNDSIIGEWTGCYELNGAKYNVILSIDEISQNKCNVCSHIVIHDKDKEYEITQYFHYNNDLNKKDVPQWNYEGEWEEYVGTIWSKENENIIDYLFNVYVINKKLTSQNKLEVLIWDNVNRDRIKVLFDRK
ncbi:MAG: hypothetical protein IJE76_05585 [Bacteroidales bacterium]|nr:hypothetical protein [Bacteroidales bacterium]